MIYIISMHSKVSVDGRTLSKDTSDCFITFNYRCLTDEQHRLYGIGKKNVITCNWK